MKTTSEKVHTLALNEECDMLTSNQTIRQLLDNDDCYYILEFEYKANKLSSIYFYDNNYSFICEVNAKVIENISLSNLKKLNIAELKDNIKKYDSNSKCYKDSLIKLFLYKRFIAPNK